MVFMCEVIHMSELKFTCLSLLQKQFLYITHSNRISIIMSYYSIVGNIGLAWPDSLQGIVQGIAVSLAVRC